MTTQTTPQKSSNKQRLRTDLGRSVGITTANQLLWLSGLRAQLPHSPQQPCNQKDTHLKFINKPPYIDNKPATPSGEVIKSNTQSVYVHITTSLNKHKNMLIDNRTGAHKDSLIRPIKVLNFMEWILSLDKALIKF